MKLILLSVFVLAVSIFDLRERRIPNFLVFPAALIGLGMNTYLLRMNGLGFGLIGLFTGFSLLILPYVVGGMKAGDVKFLAAIGSFVGAADIVRVLLAALLCYPAFAAVAVIRERKLRLTWLRFRRVFFNFMGFFLPGMRLYALRLDGLDDPGIPSATTPFGVSIAAGALIVMYSNFLR
jgi:prepilin peptidase CpaA